jgi:hypothetical protein
VGAQSYERTSSAHQQRRFGKNGKVKDFDEPLSDNWLQLCNNDWFFVFLAVDLG